MPSDAFPLAARGVYCQPFLIRGRREYYAVDSQGEQIASRLVRNAQDPARVIAELWEELEEVDPIAPHLTPPSSSLRLVD